MNFRLMTKISLVNVLIIFQSLIIFSCDSNKSLDKHSTFEQNNSSVKNNIAKDSILTIDLDSDELMKYCEFIVACDSASINIQKGKKVLYSHAMPNGFYPDFVEYDRLTGFISFNQCSKIKNQENRWSYELKVWDYKTDKEWSFRNGKSYDGEGLDVPTMINYNDNEKTGIIWNVGWESYYPTYYKNGIELPFNNLRYACIQILAVLPDDEYIVSFNSDDESDDGPHFAKYSYKTSSSVILSMNELQQYKDIIIKQFGKNISSHNTIQADICNWNTQGTVFIYSSYNSSNKNNDYFFCNSDVTKKYIIQTDKSRIIPIWK